MTSSHAYFDFKPTFHQKNLIFDFLQGEEQDKFQCKRRKKKGVQIYKNKKKHYKEFRETII